MFLNPLRQIVLFTSPQVYCNHMSSIIFQIPILLYSSIFTITTLIFARLYFLIISMAMVYLFAVAFISACCDLFFISHSEIILRKMALLCNTPDTNILSLFRTSVITCAENMCLYLFLSRMEIP